MRRVSQLAVVLAVFWTGTAVAEDVFDPPWDPGLPNQTSQEWNARIEDGIPTGGPDDPIWLPDGVQIDPWPDPPNNPYGWPMVTIRGLENTVQVIDGPHDGEDPIPTWHIGPGGGSIEIFVPNFPEPNLRKWIFLQVTADKSVTPQGDPPTTDPPGTSLAGQSPYTHKQWEGTWYTYQTWLEITPNPDGETIKFEGLVESTNISEIVVDTVCTNVPEPSNLLLLAVGAVGLLVCAGQRRWRG